MDSLVLAADMPTALPTNFLLEKYPKDLALTTCVAFAVALTRHTSNPLPI